MPADHIDPEPGEAGLLQTLRDRTRQLHAEAERTGIVRDVLRGEASRFGYALLLRNLLPAYRQLEREADSLPATFAPGIISAKALYRTNAIRRDLEALYGTRWDSTLPLLASGERYADRISDAVERNRKLLLAHAYVRYLGDLNGGQILKKILLRKVGIPQDALNFYMFPDIDDIEQFKLDYTDALAVVVNDSLEIDAVANEAVSAFNLNIEVSCDVKSLASDD